MSATTAHYHHHHHHHASHHSSIQDRTPEFRSILAQAQKSLARQRKPGSAQSQPLLGAHGAAAANGSPAQPTRTQRSEFARNAAAIGRGISATVGKLQRLGELARRKTLFDDRPVEIAELTFVIKQDLAALNQQIGQLQVQAKAVPAGPGAAAAKGRAPGADQEGEHNKNVVVLLQGRLADVGVHFKEVLEVRTKNIQASRSRQDNFVSAVSQQSGGGTGVGGGPGGGGSGGVNGPGRTDSPLYQTPAGPGSTPRGRRSPFGKSADLLTLDPDGGASSSSPLYGDASLPGGGQSQQQLLVLEEGAHQHSNSYIQQRGEAIEAIERTINELGGIFGQLAQMVSEQAEQIQRIDANTDDVVDNVAGAQRELLRYWSRVQGNRWLIAQMFGVLMVFFLIWVLVAA